MTAAAAGPTPQPSGRWSAEAQARSSASVTEVWPLIGEAHRWKDWSFLTRTELVEVGDPDPDGVGAVRRFSRYGIGSREQVVAFEPPRHLAYTILSGFPVRHYLADVTLTTEEDGTLIKWSATFDPKIPGTGHLMVLVLTRMIGQFARGVAGHADQLRDRGPQGT
jgi:Polyketide cyclase / dehydrase and lipid transport